VLVGFLAAEWRLACVDRQCTKNPISKNKLGMDIYGDSAP